MNNILYTVSSTVRSLTLATGTNRTLSFQGVRNNRNFRKDIVNSAPGVEIINATLERTEVSGGVTYHVYVVTFERSYRSTDGTQTVKTSMTATFRVPQAVIANTDIRDFAVACWTLLGSGATTDTAAAVSSTAASQLESVLLGSI